MTADLEHLLLHSRTSKGVKAYIQKPSHALLLVGPEGSGKTRLAQTISQNIAGRSLDTNPYFTHVKLQEGKQDIPIEAIRQVIRSMRLKTPDSSTIRVILIEDSHYMSLEAQNALLKVLEEPPEDVRFILTSTSESALLPTIASRTQKITVYAISLAEAVDFFSGEFTKEDIKSNWLLSKGNIGLLSALLDRSSDHPLRIAVEESKNFIKKNKYERLLMAEKIASNRKQLTVFLDALARVLAALTRSSIEKSTSRTSELLYSRRLVQELNEAVEQNTSTKLVTLKLVLELKI